MRGGRSIAILLILGFAVLFIFQIGTFTDNSSDDDAIVELVQTLQDLRQRVEFLQTGLVRAQSRTEELACAVQHLGSRGGFCLTKESLDVGGNSMWDLTLSLALEDLLANQSVGDLGAGLGWYGRFFLRINKPLLAGTGNKTEHDNFFSNAAVMAALKKPQRIRRWKGYDGAVFVREMTSGLVNYLDLSEPVWLTEKFDWVLSLEVGEHIPATYQDNFIDNLVRHACKGIVLSWAIPGQGGHHHVNERPNEFIKQQLEMRGFNADEAWEKVFRAAALFNWFKNTVMVFRRNVELADDPSCRVLKNEVLAPST